MMQRLVIVFSLSISALFLMSFSFALQESAPMASSQTITINVKTPSGNPAKSVKVGYSVCESISCIGGKSSFYTGSNGTVDITWNSNCNICIIYINGKAYEDRYRSGNTYYFTN